MSDMNIMAGLGVAVREFQLTTGEADYGLYIDGKVAEVTETMSDKALAVGASALPYRRLAPRRSHNAQLRGILLRPEHQVIDKFTRDQLLTSSFDPEAKKRAETDTSPKRERVNQQVVSGKALAAGEDNKDEIEAISILYSRPYVAGLRYGQVKELARRLSIKPFHIDESQPQTLLRLWQAFGTVAPDLSLIHI